MPRSPLVTRATKELALYFQAITDGAFIDRSYRAVTSKQERNDKISDDPALRIETNRAIISRIVDYAEGTETADHISNLINGAVGFASFYQAASGGLTDVYKEEFRFLKDSGIPKEVTPTKLVERSPIMKLIGDGEGDPSSKPTTENPNFYAILVNNPYMGPTTRDTGAVEIFMNAIPTLEFSKCVPYIGLEIISLRRSSGAVAPPLTLLGYLNPSKLGSADLAMINGQQTTVRSEVLEVGPGIRSGIELFTMPQTLANLGDTGPEFVPVIDRFRPIASLGSLSLSTKLQGGALSFTTGKLEITIHERSRLREVATFVRPDLYGTTFLDITHGWSHPDGGVLSDNSYGKFLDALKTTTRYRVSNSSYSFEEGGQIKVTLSIQSVGSVDLLYLGPRQTTPSLVTLQNLIREINERLAELRFRGTSPSMAPYDILDTFKDPSSALRAGGDADFIKKLTSAIPKMKDGTIRKNMNELVGILTKGSKQAGGVLSDVQKALVKPYDEIIERLPTFEDKDEFVRQFMEENRFKFMNNNNVRIDGVLDDGTPVPAQTVKALSDVANNSTNPSEFISFGSAFMKMVAEPVAKSGQYDEVQVIFYPFNQYAGAVHDLPISSFPLEKGRLSKAIQEIVKYSPELSARSIIKVLYDKFIHFMPSRAYLMAGFYQEKKDDSTKLEMEAKPLKESYTLNPGKGKRPINVAANLQLTFEERLRDAGVPEGKFKTPVVEVAVEAAPMLDVNGAPIVDEATGNPKTIIKMHVYDSAMDPHATLTDIISAAKDNELGVINLPVAQYQSAVQSVSRTGLTAQAMINKYNIPKTLSVGLESGVLEAVSKDNLEVVNNIDDPEFFTKLFEGAVFLRVKSTYDEIKKLVSSGMPTITYGSSMTALTTANLTTGGSAGLANVQLQRAFASPGETAAENVDTGVPMQLIPAQLSISTIGCPLFYPMQRFFVDFGTGTSIDNVYFVTSVDSNISREGYKTDVKMSFGEGFATYRSLNQKLAMMAANWSDATRGNNDDDGSAISIDQAPVVLGNLRDTSENYERLLAEAFALAGQIGDDAAAEAQRVIAQTQTRAALARAEAERSLQSRLEAKLDDATRQRLRDVETEIARTQFDLGKVETAAEKAKILAEGLAEAERLADSMPGGLPSFYLAQAVDKREREKAIAKSKPATSGSAPAK
jgi:hypothetical protein